MQTMLRFELWAARVTAFLLAALAAGSAAYWWLHWPSAAGEDRREVAVAIMGETALPPDAAHLARLLGGTVASDSSALAGSGQQRWRLLGVVAGAGGRGAALIAEDDKPARAYTVGSLVAQGWYLKAVEPRRALLAPAPSAAATLILDLPPAAEAAVLSGGFVAAPSPQLRAAP